jgi:hypothetical protein
MYSKLIEAYSFHGLRIGGLGENVLSQPLCFCTQKKTIDKFVKSAIRCHKGKCGVCSTRWMCNNKCVPKMDNYCTAKALGL